MKNKKQNFYGNVELKEEIETLQNIRALTAHPQHLLELNMLELNNSISQLNCVIKEGSN